MPRPVKFRIMDGYPGALVYKPAGVPKRDLEEMVLTFDEFEAIRLADHEGCYQEDAAARMGVSRQTFGNIIVAARRKIAACLVDGKALRIEGGFVEMTERRFTCEACGHGWALPFGTGRPQGCPACNSAAIHRAEDQRGQGRIGFSRGRRQYRGGQK